MHPEGLLNFVRFGHCFLFFLGRTHASVFLFFLLIFYFLRVFKAHTLMGYCCFFF